MQRNVVGMAALVIGLGLAGCGGSGALTKAEFTKQANAVCATALTRLASMNGNRVDAYVARVVAYQRAKTQGIGALKPPKELQQSFNAYKSALTVRGAFMQQQAVMLRQSQKPPASAGAQASRLQGREEQLALELGLSRCREVRPHSPESDE